jgi:hypothetical protein
MGLFKSIFGKGVRTEKTVYPTTAAGVLSIILNILAIILIWNYVFSGIHFYGKYDEFAGLLMGYYYLLYGPAEFGAIIASILSLSKERSILVIVPFTINLMLFVISLLKLIYEYNGPF